MIDASAKFEQRILQPPRYVEARSKAQQGTATERRGYIDQRRFGVAARTLNPERKAAARNAAYIYKRGIGILEQTLNHDFRFAAIHNLRIDYVIT